MRLPRLVSIWIEAPFLDIPVPILTWRTSTAVDETDMLRFIAQEQAQKKAA
jgi:hypothetical protein